MKQIKLNTEISVEPSEFKISHSDSIFLLGSCFTENMGKRMAELDFRTMINPFGILYNPLSMAMALTYCLDNKRVGEEDLVFRDDLWHSWLHHGAFSRRDKQECIESCNRAISEAHEFLQSCNTLIVTFGSAWYYTLKESGMVVANCHKVPASLFEKRLATVEEVVDAWKPLVDRLLEGGVRIIFTISPVRHQAYGAHGNQLGKAVLLLATEQIINLQHSTDMHKASPYILQPSYFPSYEIVVDELRDYRYYADDMAHPSPLAEEIVWQRFLQTFMTQETIARCDEKEKQNRRNAHKPLFIN